VEKTGKSSTSNTEAWRRIIKKLADEFPCDCAPYCGGSIFAKHLPSCPWEPVGFVLEVVQAEFGLPDEIFDLDLTKEKSNESSS